MFARPSKDTLAKIRAVKTPEQRRLLACACHLGLNPSKISRVNVVTDGGGHYTGFDVVVHIRTGQQVAVFVEEILATAVIEKTHRRGFCNRCNVVWCWPKGEGRRNDFLVTSWGKGPRCNRCANPLISTRRVHPLVPRVVGATRKMIFNTWS